MNTDSDLKFTVRTDNPMFRSEGSFKSFRSFYFALMDGFQIPIQMQHFIFNDITIFLREYHLKHLN